MSVREWYEPECDNCGTYHNSDLYCVECVCEFVYWLKDKKIDLDKQIVYKKGDWLDSKRDTEENIAKLFKKFQKDSDVSKKNNWVFLKKMLIEKKETSD